MRGLSRMLLNSNEIFYKNQIVDQTILIKQYKKEICRYVKQNGKKRRAV